MFDAAIHNAAPLQELRQCALKLIDGERKEGTIADRAARFPADVCSTSNSPVAESGVKY